MILGSVTPALYVVILQVWFDWYVVRRLDQPTRDRPRGVRACRAVALAPNDLDRQGSRCCHGAHAVSAT